MIDQTDRPISINVILMVAFIFTVIPAKADNIITQRINDFEMAFTNGKTVFKTIEERMSLHRVPGMSIAVIKNGQLHWAKGYGLQQANSDDFVDTDTVFSVGSISKVVTAAITLRLVGKNILDLDTDVNNYLTRWKIVENKYTAKQAVTLRHILSHTAGFNIHGFADFQPDEKLPTVIETLSGKSPAKHGPVKVGFVPGTNFKYSGGGITVEQLIIQEVTSKTFPDTAKHMVFNPLAMNRSTFLNPLPVSHGNIAKAHDKNGMPKALPRGWESMPEMAASGLWTTPGDLAKLLIKLMQAYQGKDAGFISNKLAIDMMSKANSSEFGLGPEISGINLFSHGGANDSYNAFMMGNLQTGNAIVVLTNSVNGRRLCNEIIETMKQIEQW